MMSIRSAHLPNRAQFFSSQQPQHTLPKIVPITSSSPCQTVYLPNYVKNEFSKRVQHEMRNPYESYTLLAPVMGAVLEDLLPENIKLLLKNLSFTDKTKFIYIKNCPHTENPGPTPELDKHSKEKGYIDELFMLGMSYMRHTVIYHEQKEKFGEVIGHIIAQKGKEDHRSSQGSSTEFGEHTEQIYLDKPFDWVTLHCIKGDKNACTEVATVENFLEGLSEEDISLLQQPLYEMTTGAVWIGSSPLKKIFPILEFTPSGQPLIRYHKDESRLAGINNESRTLLKKLQDPSRSIKRARYYLEPGDYLSINNRTSLHGRGGYLPSNAWSDRRWVLRAYEYNDYVRMIARIKASQTLIQNA